MKKLITTSLTAIFLLAGCQEEPSDNGIGTGNYYASVEEFSSDTKTTLGEGNRVVWSDEDRIAIFEGHDEGQAYQILDSYIGKSTGEFSIIEGVTTEGGSGSAFDKTIAVYPYNDELAVSYNENGYIISGVIFPQDQQYTSCSFADEAFPMVASTSKGAKDLSFKNIGGVLKISLYGSLSVKKITLTGHSEERLSGDAFVKMGTDGSQRVVMSQNASKSVSLHCNPAVQLSTETATVFYISTPVTYFKAGFTITVTDSEGNEKARSTSRKQSIGRSCILSMPEYELDNIISSGSTENYINLRIGTDASIISYDENNGQLSLDYGQSEIPDIQNGKAFIMPQAYQYDIRVINGHKISGNTVNLETSQGNMCNLFKNTSFTLVTQSSPSTRSYSGTNVITPSAYGYVDSEGNYNEIYNIDTRSAQFETNMEFWSFKKNFNNETLIEGNAGRLYWETCSFNAGLNGEFTFDFGEQQIDESHSIGDLNYFKYVLTGSIDMDFLLHYQYLAEYSEKNDEIIKENIIPALRFTFAVGSVPVHIQVETHLGKQTEFSAEGKIDASAGVKIGTRVDLGTEWDKTNGFKAINAVTPYFTFHQPKLDIEASASAKVSYYPHLDIKLYKFLGPWIEPRPYLSGEIGAGVHLSTEGSNVIGWKSETFTGMDLKMGLLLDFGVWEKNLWTSDTYSPIKPKLLFQAPARITKVSPDDMTLIPDGESIATEFLVESFSPLTDNYYPCPLALVNFKTDYGDVSPDFAISDTDGKVSTEWQPSADSDNSDNSQDNHIKELTASIVDKSGKSIDEASLRIGTEEDDIRKMLIKLYQDTDGDNWTNNENWCSDKPINEWYGIVLLEDRGEFIIYLNNNNLDGTIDLSNFMPLTSLYCQENNIKSIDVSESPNLRVLHCNGNNIENLYASNCSALASFKCQRNLLKHIDVSGCVSLTTLWCDDNLLTNIDLNGLENIRELSCENNPALKHIDVSNCINLYSIESRFCPQLENIELTNCSSIENLRLWESALTNLNFEDCIKLKTLSLSSDKMAALECKNHKYLESVTVSGAYIDLIDFSKCANLKNANVHGSGSAIFKDCTSLVDLESSSGTNMPKLKKIDVSGCTLLQEINCQYNNLSSINLYGCTSLISLFCNDNNIETINLDNCSCNFLFCSNNRITNIISPNNQDIKEIDCRNNPIIKIDLSNCINLKEFHMGHNSGTNTDVNLNGCTSLLELIVSSNHLSRLDISGCTSMKKVECRLNDLTEINISGCSSLESLDCSYNALTSLDISDCINLNSLNCRRNELYSIDISSNPKLKILHCSSNNIFSEVPAIFKQLDEFGHDQRYGYRREPYYDSMNGWWYPGEPEKGYHGW